MRLIVFAVLLPLAACGNFSSDDDTPGIAATGSGGARSFAASDFTNVDLRGADDVDVRVGSGFSVRAEGDPAVLDKLKITRVGDTLRVGRVNSNGFNWSGGGKHAKVYVTLPRMTGGSVSGSGNMAIDRVEGAKFEGAIAGSGNLAVATLAVQSAELSIAGSGDLSAGGNVQALELSIAGSGDIDAGKLTATKAEVSIAGSGSARATVDGPAEVSVMGSGDVDLGPKARCTTSKMGSGSVRCGG